jgi:hypothetical protein
MVVSQQTQQEDPALADSGSGRRSRYRPEEPPPKVAVDHDGAHYTVSVTGQVHRSTMTEFSGTLRGLLAVGVTELTVDLRGCWEGAKLLTALARTRRTLSDRDGTLHLVGVALPEYLGALREAPLDEVFLVYDAVRHTG